MFLLSTELVKTLNTPSYLMLLLIICQPDYEATIGFSRQIVPRGAMHMFDCFVFTLWSDAS